MKKRKKLPNTPTQRWLIEKGACWRGREEVGAQTLSTAFHTSRNSGNMYWLLGLLIEGRGLVLPSTMGRRAPLASTLRVWAKNNDVMIPLGV
jgi:hypothetical protein